MKKVISKKEFIAAESKMNELLKIVTKKGGFANLTSKENASLNKYTKIVKDFEDAHYTIPAPQTIQGLIRFKMFEKQIKQKELAQLMNITDTNLSEIMNHKRKPSLSFLKAMNHVLEIDGNLLLQIA